MRTSKIVGLSTVMALAGMAAPVAALQPGTHLAIGVQLLAQNAGGGVADRKEAETLLRRAREAMKEGKLETADSLIGRAEAMHVEYKLFHLGDTPKRARKDLDALEGSGGHRKPQRPSQKFSPPAEQSDAEPSRGRAGADRRAPADRPPQGDGGAEPTMPSRPANASRLLEQPPIEDDRREPGLAKPDLSMTRSPFSRPAMSAPPREDDAVRPIAQGPNTQGTVPQSATRTLDVRRQSDGLLLGARRALAVGDVRRASAAIEQAKNLQVGYGFHDDSPAKVESLIRKYVDVIEAVSRDNTEAARQQYAAVLMEESQHLLRWKDFDEAERLANDASRLKVNFGPFESRPEALREKISAARKQSHSGNTAPVRQPRELPGAGQNVAATTAGAAGGLREALELAHRARKALAAGNIEEADKLARAAEQLKVPEAAFGPRDDRPWMVSLEIQKARYRNLAVTPAGGSAVPQASAGVQQTIFDPRRDTTRTRLAGAEEASDEPAQIDPSADATAEQLPALGPEELPQTAPLSDPAPDSAAPNATMQLFLEGERALQQRDTKRAAELFSQAYSQRDELDPVVQQRLQDHLQRLAMPTAKPRTAPSLLEGAVAKQELMVRQLSAEIAKQEAASRKMQEKEPKKAMELLKQARAQAESAEIDGALKAQLLRRVDRSIADLAKHIEAHRDQIELDDHNKEVLSEIDRNQRMKIEVDARLAKLVNEFNTLIDEERYAEAEVVAKRAKELDHNNPVVKQLEVVAKFIRRKELNQSVRDRKERGEQAAWESVIGSSEPMDDRDPIQFPDAKTWEGLTKSRRQQLAKNRSHLSEHELEIQRKLRTPVSLRFRDKPLTEVLESLAKLAAVNLHLDPKGLSDEGVASDTPVTIDLTQDITLKSALNLILEPLHLSYVIKDEVLKITSEQLRDGHVYQVTYNVGDLVIPIPNFTPNGRIGLAGALADAYGAMGVGNQPGFGGSTPVALASQNGAPASGVVNSAILAQMNQLAPGAGGGTGATGVNQPIGFGPGGVGGGAEADFESLIELITTTVAPTTWDESGGPGSIKEFETNLSLVIRQTQEVHEEIVELLEQLRRNQDLQVTIEVRFITLNDNFFERIGVDFDFNIDDNVLVDPATLEDGGPSVTVGLQDAAPDQPFPNFTADLDIPFRQESFSLATPQFGQPVDVARFGFAILSDIEAYFLVAAAQGDRRSNVLQAPKVTMFNGQQAVVSDTSQTPFVISVIPVVGDFAAAQQPVIVVLSEGTFLTVQAVVTEDRRFVRLTVVPFFSQIGDVEEFTFSGSRTTTKNTSQDQEGGDTTSSTDDETVSTEGVTVQLPTFSFVTVTTTVSVPDGGTVLLGGIKRLSEGRNEFGVPILSKLPYINRLFKNVGIGRETQSLMMMVTPRIIIQEEEEERLGVLPPETP